MSDMSHAQPDGYMKEKKHAGYAAFERSVLAKVAAFVHDMGAEEVARRTALSLTTVCKAACGVNVAPASRAQLLALLKAGR